MSEYYKKNLKYKQASYKKYMQSVSKKIIRMQIILNSTMLKWKCQNQYVRVYTIITVR